jgi:hypothetical protein
MGHPLFSNQLQPFAADIQQTLSVRSRGWLIGRGNQLPASFRVEKLLFGQFVKLLQPLRTNLSRDLAAWRHRECDAPDQNGQILCKLLTVLMLLECSMYCLQLLLNRFGEGSFSLPAAVDTE